MDLLKMLGVDKDELMDQYSAMAEMAKESADQINTLSAIMPKLRDALLNIDARLSVIESVLKEQGK